MIEQTVKIVAIEGDQAWIESLSLHGCARCEAGEGCGGGIFAKLFSNKQFRMKIDNTLSLQQGDKVVIGIQDSAVTNASFISYILPLLGLIVGALLGSLFDPIGSESWTLVGAVLGISISFLMSKLSLNSDSFKARYTPTMIRKELSLQQFEPSSP